LCGELGFRIQGQYSEKTPILDLQEGQYLADRPNHQHYIEDVLAKTTSEILAINFYNDLDNIHINRTTKKELLAAYQTYVSLHVQDFGEIKSLPVLQELFS
jgi:DNA repair protein RecO (recombination protein O)